MPEPANIPYLPPEVLVPILAYSEESQCCLINLLSRGSLKCEESNSFTTVIYTRGDYDLDGDYTGGSIEALPFQHRCVHGTRWHLTKRVVVMDMGSEEDNRNEALRAVREHCPNGGLLNLTRVLKFMTSSSIKAKLNFWDKRIFDTIPLANNNDSGSIGPEIDNGAYANRLRPEDPQLTCEKIRHLMIRPVFNCPDKIIEIIREELEEQLGEYHPANCLASPLELNYYRAMDFMLRLDWHLLRNLEVLCLDLTGVDLMWRYSQVQASFVEMGRHLKLKTLILLGAPCRARYDDKGKEAWVAALEDDEYVEESRFRPTDWGTANPSLISVLKETLRPGGQIHFISFLIPGDPWSSCSEEEKSTLDKSVTELVVQGIWRHEKDTTHNEARRRFESHRFESRSS